MIFFQPDYQKLLYDWYCRNCTIQYSTVVELNITMTHIMLWHTLLWCWLTHLKCPKALLQACILGHTLSSLRLGHTHVLYSVILLTNGGNHNEWWQLCVQYCIETVGNWKKMSVAKCTHNQSNLSRGKLIPFFLSGNEGHAMCSKVS